MSSKINVLSILSSHFATLVDAKGGKVMADYFVFFVLPIGAALLGFWFGFAPAANSIELVLNFASILTALLLSVLVLVYDLRVKTESTKAQDPEGAGLKSLVLGELHANICFAIIVSILLVVLCLIYSAILESGVGGKLRAVIGAFVTFFSLNLVLTILMVLKRLDVLMRKSIG